MLATIILHNHSMLTDLVSGIVSQELGSINNCNLEESFQNITYGVEKHKKNRKKVEVVIENLMSLRNQLE